MKKNLISVLALTSIVLMGCVSVSEMEEDEMANWGDVENNSISAELVTGAEDGTFENRAGTQEHIYKLKTGEVFLESVYFDSESAPEKERIYRFDGIISGDTLVFQANDEDRYNKSGYHSQFFFLDVNRKEPFTLPYTNYSILPVSVDVDKGTVDVKVMKW